MKSETLESGKSFESPHLDALLDGNPQEALELFFSLSPTTLQSLQEYSADSGTSLQNIVEQAVQSWVASRSKLSKTSN